MLINRASLQTLGTSFNALFSSGLGQADPLYDRVAMVTPSTTGKEEYGWLGRFPSVREWLGDRVIQNIATAGYAIRNKPFELTVSVSRDDIEDDNIGIYAPMFTELGRAAGAHYDQLVWPLLKAGFSTSCYDGQYFFDVDHPVLDAAGKTISVANTDAVAGTGPAWFLLDTSRAIRPIILQKRRPFQFIRLDRETDDNVFSRREYVYGADARHNVGYGLWQFAWGSKKDLTADNFNAAYAALSGMTGDYGHPLGIRPTLLVVPPALRSQALKILKAETGAAGETNVNRGAAEVLVVPWLA